MKRVKIKIIFILTTYFFLYLSALCFIEKPFLGIRINRTPSIPHKLFLSCSFRIPKKYDYISLHHQSTPKLLVKQIIGIAGDRIAFQNEHIFVNDYDCGKALNFTTAGTLLTPIEMKEIPEGFVFVHAPHPQSFDSRYQQFGLIPFNHLQEVLWPIY